MVARRPLVNISGLTTELPPGDSVVGGSVGTLTAGSGLNGGGDLSSAVTVNVSLAPNPSGLLFADGKLGVDGVARVTGAAALASGNFSLSTGTDALASGIAGSQLAATALASGNAALADISAIPGGTIETYTAASAVISGYAVGLDNNGKVQSLNYQSNTSNTFTVNTLSRFYTGTSYGIGDTSTGCGVIYDTINNKFVITYKNNNQYGACVVASVAGTTVTSGPEVVYRSATVYYPVVAHDVSANKLIFAYSDNSISNYGYCIHGTLSGNFVSFAGSSAVSFFAVTGGVAALSILYFPPANRTILLSRSGWDGAGYLYNLAVSGGSISVAGGNQLVSSMGFTGSLAYSTSDSRYLAAFRDENGYWSCRLGNLSGTTFSQGTRVTLYSGTITGNGSCVYDPDNDKFIVTYQDSFTANVNAVPVTITNASTNTITVGYSSSIISSSNTFSRTIYDTAASRAIVLSNSSTTGRGTVAAISGSTVVDLLGGSPFNWSFGVSSNGWGLAYSPDSKNALIAYNNGNNSTSSGLAFVNTPLFSEAIYPTISSQNNFIGIAQTTAASGSAVQVRLPGSYDQNNTGLTPGAVYYVDPTTSGFTTTATQPPVWSGAVNWAPIGRAVNSTTLLLTDMI